MTHKSLFVCAVAAAVAVALVGCVEDPTDPTDPAEPITEPTAPLEAVGITELRCEALDVGQPTVTAIADVTLQEGHVFHFTWLRMNTESDSTPPTKGHDCAGWTPISYPINGREEVWACRRTAGQPERQLITGVERDSTSYPFNPFQVVVNAYVATEFASSSTSDRVELVSDEDRVSCE